MGNDVFERYYHRKLRISSVVCKHVFIHTQDNICYFSQRCGSKLRKIMKKCYYVEIETGFFFFQVLENHQQAMPTCSKLRHRLYLQNTETYK